MNGAAVDPSAASVSIFDRGFLYGDSVYEVLRTYGGVPFALDAHLSRLHRSAERIGMVLPVPFSRLAEEVHAAHEESGNEASYLRVVVTRGRGRIGLDPGLADQPVWLVLAQPVEPPPPELYAGGAAVAVVSVKKNHKDAIDPEAKTGNYLNSVLATAEARRLGAYEAILLDGAGRVTEGASSNVFAVVGGVLLTPPLDVGILGGITRRALIGLARAEGRRVLELPFTASLFQEADEACITSSIREIVPVVRVDGAPVGDGRPGPVVGALRAAFGRLTAGQIPLASLGLDR